MTEPTDTVYLIDVDNTLLDNDRIIADLRQHLEEAFGMASADRYWETLETLRTELGYVDYLGALQHYRNDESLRGMKDSRLLLMSGYLIDYPFADRVYPGALDALKALRQRGPVAIVSDGDVVFQPRKVQQAALWDAVEGRVLIYVHKEQMLDAISAAYPARHYVMIDDKLRILSAMKAVWGARLTTVFVRQGHYALDTQALAAYAPADITVERIGDLVDYQWPALPET
ncbi:FMN phosphatase YigB (HAD superfamily) [Variovorax sp. GrIS 2.14]|uniref:HAD family hydrolase n=1 Tax=unclassified Variovorax TaxID=663243 RepID=UPI002B23E7FB|nr:HAD family hydrolase [Variovorax sp. RTB1]MEB0112319.1 HAD family hydrolase [Variovorax sp. RTB1]